MPRSSTTSATSTTSSVGRRAVVVEASAENSPAVAVAFCAGSGPLDARQRGARTLVTAGRLRWLALGGGLAVGHHSHGERLDEGRRGGCEHLDVRGEEALDNSAVQLGKFAEHWRLSVDEPRARRHGLEMLAVQRGEAVEQRRPGRHQGVEGLLGGDERRPVFHVDRT
ncbi:MAG: hypothetical protein ACKO27_09715 [Ilumatobacteraceae bacterium]